MRRRTLLKMAAISAGAVTTHSSFLNALTPDATPNPTLVKKVLLVTKCHLDVGFTLTQEKVMRQYFDVYYPAAIKTAADMRQTGEDRYVWTTGSWLLYEYLEQASASQRKAMEQSIVAGDITWHALPFTWQTEMLDPSMIEGGLAFSTSLDRRFGHKTIGAKMTDVPGHSRGIIAPLAASGISLLDVGINGASTPPDVPDIFLWKDSDGNSLAMLYHRHDYGSVLQIPGTNVAVDIEVRGDNGGPHTAAEISAIYAKLRTQFPNATIHASDLNAVAAAVNRVRDALPVVTEEIGDTWIYGVASDPIKVARFREVARLRQGWIAQGRFAVGDNVDRQLLRRLLLAAEHTWGTDTKSYLDNAHYLPRDLAAVLQEPGYKVMQVSWQEKRDNIDSGVATLPEDLRHDTATRLALLVAGAPSSQGMTPWDPSHMLETTHYIIGIDPGNGSITRLLNRNSGREWASAQHPLGLFTYQTLSSANFAAYIDRYITIKADWAPRDFGKPGIDQFNAVSQEWHPTLQKSWSSHNSDEDRLLLLLSIEDAAAMATGNVAWPKQIYVDLRLPSRESQLDLRVTTLDKKANRMPEAMWLTFAPETPDLHGWNFEKVGQQVTASDVIRGGGRSMHAVTEVVRYQDNKNNALQIHTMDAPLVALGERSPINFSFQLPKPAGGVHVCLFNNAWGTNYLQWAGGDWSYRFKLFG